jgi:serralysin
MSVIFEGNDAASGVSTAYRMAVGDDFYGTNAEGETDWIAVTLQAGVQYNFAAIGIGAANSGLSAPLITLHGPKGRLLAADDDGGPGVSASLTFTANTSGTYFIEVEALSGQNYSYGRYGLTVTEGALPSFSVDMAAAVLYGEGTSWAATPGTGITLTWGVRASGPAYDAEGSPTPFIQVTAAQTAAMQTALANFAQVADINFSQVNAGGTTNNATILVGAYDSTSDGAGAYAYFPGYRGIAGDKSAGSIDGDLWINNDSVSQSNLPFGSYDYFVVLHELGHALGLSHPGDYNAAPGVIITYQNSAQFVQDSGQYSVMSYFDATDTQPMAPGSYADTLMMFDIYALQELYGINGTTRANDDTYGFHATVGGAYDFTVNKDPLLCIWDGAGRDTLDLSGFRGKQMIDLNAGSFSDVGGFKGNLSIAIGCKIENATGGRGADTIYGNVQGNVLKGGAGLDILIGGAGNDRMAGGNGADGFVFAAGDGRDRIVDFNKTVDVVSLNSDLWDGRALSEAEVLAEFAKLRGGNLVFDFGADELTLVKVSSLAGMVDDIVLV